MAALFSFCALFSSAAFAQLDGIVAKPNVKVDDRWLYRRMDHRFEPPVLLYELRVTFVDAHAIHTVLARQGRPRESDATWTSEWNSVVSVDDGVVEIKSGLLQFPLSVGRAYQSMWEMRRPRAGKFHVLQVKRWRRAVLYLRSGLGAFLSIEQTQHFIEI